MLAANWIPIHVSFSLAGYAALLLAFLAGVMYLIQERELKRKNPRAFYYRLPPLETIDHLSSKALAIGFPFIITVWVIGFIVFGLIWLMSDRKEDVRA